MGILNAQIVIFLSRFALMVTLNVKCHKRQCMSIERIHVMIATNIGLLHIKGKHTE